METRVAVMSIIVENPDSVEKLNAMLHEYGPYIIGRMGYSLPSEAHQHRIHRHGRAAGYDLRSGRESLGIWTESASRPPTPM